MPLRLLPLVKKNEGKPLGADQAGLPRTCLPPLTKLNEAADGGGPEELTDKPCSEGNGCLPRGADYRRPKTHLLPHD